MSNYIPSPVPQEPEQIPPFLSQELQRISDIQNQPFSITKIYKAPDKPFSGQIVYADGTHWNPGSGEGLYYFKTNIWVHIA